jgi:hypothetical protein
MAADSDSKYEELLQPMQRDFNCLIDANRATRSDALNRLRRKLLPIDSKVCSPDLLFNRDEWPTELCLKPIFQTAQYMEFPEGYDVGATPYSCCAHFGSRVS